MKQYNCLVIYLNEKDKQDFIKQCISDERLDPCLKSELNTKNKTLTVQYSKGYFDDDLHQISYNFINPEVHDLPMFVCGKEFFNVMFLEGKYHSHDIAYSLSRMRGGVYEVEGL